MQRQHPGVLIAALMVGLLVSYIASYYFVSEVGRQAPNYALRTFAIRKLHLVYYPAGFAEALLTRKRIDFGERNRGQLEKAARFNPWMFSHIID